MKKLLFFFNLLMETFWFVPFLIIITSVLLAIGFVYLDEVMVISQDGLGRFFFVNSPESARTILSTISGTMIGVAGTVFSVTLVTLTLASSQFGPRLIKNFMYVRLHQVVLGSYVATYLYSLIVLNTIKGNNDITFIPALSILFATVAAFVNILLLIVFIHQIAVSIQADKVISDISDIIAKQLNTLFPKEIGHAPGDGETPSVDDYKSRYTHNTTIKSPRNGYLQYIDGESLLDEEKSFDGLIELRCKPGDHLVEGAELGIQYTNSPIDDEQIDRILNHMVIGKTKNAQQDLAFSIYQMVEIAVRALSPGVNDPYTAIACIDNLTATLCHLAQVKFPSKYRMDDKKNLRIIASTLDFEGILDASFSQIRQFSGGSVAVLIRLLEALITVQAFTKTKSHRQAVVKHADMVLHVGKESISEKNDLDDLLDRSKRIIRD